MLLWLKCKLLWMKLWIKNVSLFFKISNSLVLTYQTNLKMLYQKLRLKIRIF
jgi:hypothetical protein